MLKFIAHANDFTPIFGIGLSEDNIQKLREDQPILIKLREITPFLPDIAILIFTGALESTLLDKATQNEGGEVMKGLFI